MTLQDVLQEITACLDEGYSTLSWEQARYWPKGAIDTLEKAGYIKATTLAETVECPGCEENCFMPVNVYPVEEGKPFRPSVVACDKRDDIGLVQIEPERLQQWKIIQRNTEKLIVNH